MGTVPWTVYAPTRRKEHWQLPDGLHWQTVQLKVKRLQVRIAKAAKQGASVDQEELLSVSPNYPMVFLCNEEII